MKTAAACLLIILLTTGTVSAITFPITPTPTVKLVAIKTTTAPPPGTLVITRNAYGNLYIDGQYANTGGGTAPYTVQKSPGTYPLIYSNTYFYANGITYRSVESYQGLSLTKNVVVYSGRTTTIDLVAHPTGVIRITGLSPGGGDLYIDNERYRSDLSLPLGVTTLPGLHKVQYQKTGYIAYDQIVTVSGLQETPVSIALQPLPAAAQPANPPAAVAADPVIATNKPVVVQGQKFVLTITSTPATDYYLYTVNVPLAPGRSYPTIDAAQVSVDTSDTARSQIATRIGNSRSFANYPGTVAKIRTDSRGSRSVQFSTGAGTDAGTGGKYFTYELYDPVDPLRSGQVSVRVDPVVDADFTASPQSGSTPLTVQFSDTSTGNPETWSWDFGDGSPAATTRNPLHTYTGAGTYSVTLTASKRTGGSSSDTAGRAGYITVTAPVNPVPAIVPAATETATPTASPTGSLAVSSDPSSAAVYLDNIVRGATPVTLSGLDPGTYAVKLVRTGYPDYASSETIMAGQVTVLNVNLSSRQAQAATPALAAQPPVTTPVPGWTPGADPVTGQGFGSLSVTTEPPGAKVWVDDAMGGVSPVTIPNLAAGPHKVRLAMEGYEEINTVVTILPGQPQQYTTSLLRETDGILSGIRVPGLARTPGFEAWGACMGLCILGIGRWLFR